LTGSPRQGASVSIGLRRRRLTLKSEQKRKQRNGETGPGLHASAAFMDPRLS
jgi:hypothetical protein